MTGPEHYRFAEQLLRTKNVAGVEYPPAQSDVNRAQVHATLALAAATSGVGSYEPWHKVAGDGPALPPADPRRPLSDLDDGRPFG